MSWSIRSKCKQRMRSRHVIVGNRNDGMNGRFSTDGVLLCKGNCETRTETNSAAFATVQRCHSQRGVEMPL